MMSVYETYGIPEITKMRQAFVNMLNDWCKKEKRDCRVAKVQPNMVGDTRRKVVRLLGQCDTPWKIEALRRLVMFYNQIPEMSRITQYAEALRADALAGTNVKKPKSRFISIPKGFTTSGGILLPPGVKV
jgi:hypothetical protein